MGRLISSAVTHFGSPDHDFLSCSGNKGQIRECFYCKKKSSELIQEMDL